MNCRIGSGQRKSWRAHRETWALFATLVTLVFGAVRTLRAQEPTLDTSPITRQLIPENANPDKSNQKNASDASKLSRPGSFVIAPIPTASPAIGTGATILGGYIFPLRKSDKISPPSIIGGAWVGTDNGTRAWAAATELYFNQDRYHVVSGAAHGHLNYDFYGTGNAAGDAGRKFGLNQSADVFLGEILRRTVWRIFIGPRIWFGTSRLEPQHLAESYPNLPPLGKDFKMRSLGFKIERDTVPNRFYPQEGTTFQLASDFFAKDLGGTFTFQRHRLTFNAYRSFGAEQVVAYNLFGCSTGGAAPFFGKCIFGMQDELRGYPAGRYIDMKMLATQVEYRRTLPWRLGVAVFGGLGEVAPTFSGFNAENILPSAGVGPRVMLSSKYHVNLRADFAWGKNGNTFSMGLGESF